MINYHFLTKKKQIIKCNDIILLGNDKYKDLIGKKRDKTNSFELISFNSQLLIKLKNIFHKKSLQSCAFYLRPFEYFTYISLDNH